MTNQCETQPEKVTISTYFESDHDRLDDLFKNFQAIKQENYRKAKEFFVDFKFGLQRHIIWEEEILFPFIENKTGTFLSRPLYVMRLEHRQIGELLEALHKKVQHEDPNSHTEEMALLQVLSDHNLKEEKILYPMIDQSLSTEELDTIFSEMSCIPEERYQVCCH